MSSGSKGIYAAPLLARTCFVTMVTLFGMLMVGRGWYGNVQRERMSVCAFILDRSSVHGTSIQSLPPSAPDAWRRVGTPGLSVRSSESGMELSCAYATVPRVEWTWRVRREGSDVPRTVEDELRRPPATVSNVGALLLSQGVAWHVLANAVWLLIAAVSLSGLQGRRAWVLAFAVGVTLSALALIVVASIWPYRHPLLPYGVVVGAGLMCGALSGRLDRPGNVTWGYAAALLLALGCAWGLTEVSWRI